MAEQARVSQKLIDSLSTADDMDLSELKLPHRRLQGGASTVGCYGPYSAIGVGAAGPYGPVYPCSPGGGVYGPYGGPSYGGPSILPYGGQFENVLLRHE